MHRISSRCAARLLAAFLVLLLGGCGDDDMMWAAVATAEFEYQVEMSEDLLEDLIEGDYDEPFVHFEQVFWFDPESGAQPMAIAGKAYGYGNELYLRPDAITSIVPLKRAYVRRHLRGERDDDDDEHDDED